jgi:hypothetical protein
MLAKRKFQNFVNTYGDQSIGGKKTFTENLVVTGDLTLPDDTNITFPTSAIPQSAIVSTTGWIYDTFTTLIASVSDLVSDLTNNTFGILTTSDTISQNQISQTTENGWISAIYTYVANTYLTKSSASSTYAPKKNAVFSGSWLLFPDGSNCTDYLLVADADSYYLKKHQPQVRI